MTNKLLISFGALLLLFSFPTTGYGQLSVEDIGIRGGLNISSFNETVYESSSRTGIFAGAYITIPIPRTRIFIQPELNYSQKGAKGEIVPQGQTESVPVKFNMYYLELPVLAKIQLMQEPKKLSPYLLLGPYVGTAAFEELEFETTERISPGNPTIPSAVSIDDESRDFDYGLVGAIGTHVSLGNTDLLIEGRYSFGLGEVFEESFTITSSEKNRLFSLVVGVTL